MRDLWNLNYSTWIGVFALIVAIVSLWLFFRQIRRHRGEPKILFMELLRLLLVGLLIFTLLKPEKIVREKLVSSPLVAILADRSGSMETQDVPLSDNTVATRAEWLQGQLDTEFWGELEDRYKVEVVDFGVANPEDDNPGTDINTPLNDLVSRYDNLRAVLMLTDGVYNQGENPALAAGSVLRQKDIPVYTVGVGSDRHLPDLELIDVRAPTFGFLEETISLPFTVESQLDREIKTQVILSDPDGNKIAHTDITLPPGESVQDSVLLEPKKKGIFNYTVSVPLQTGETFDDNNKREFEIEIKQEPLRVLVIDSLPRWEYRFLRNALSRDPGVNVSCLLFHPDLPTESGAGPDYIDAFPDKREALSQFDVIFLGDVGVGEGQLTTEQCDMIKAVVEQQASGLVFLPGALGNQARLKGTGLYGLNPVELDSDNPGGTGFEAQSRLLLTARGRGHFLTKLHPDPDTNSRIWKNLPGFYWYAPVYKARSGSTVLAKHETARGKTGGYVPLLVTRPAGYGKTLFMGTDAAWRWRRGVEDTFHYRFWSQIARWMAHQRHLQDQDGIRFFYSPENPKRGQDVLLHATVFDKTGYPVARQSATVEATILNERTGQSLVMELEGEEGDWGVFTGTFTPTQGGKYTVDILCEAAGRKTKANFTVQAPVLEQTGKPIALQSLRELSQVTGGRSVDVAGLSRVFSGMNDLPQRRSSDDVYRLWSDARWAGLIILLFVVYWIFRKLMGMI